MARTLMMAIAFGSVGLGGCTSSGFTITIPPAALPTLEGTGLVIGGAGLRGQLTEVCANHQPPAANPTGFTGLYLTVRWPVLNHLRLRYRGVDGQLGDGPPRGAESLGEGPRPYNPQMIADAQGATVHYWFHSERSIGGQLEAVVAVILGAGLPREGNLELWSENTSSQHTGNAQRSIPLVLTLREPMRITRFESATNPVNEGTNVSLSWQVDHADRVTISGPGFDPAQAQPARGTRTVNVPCLTQGTSGTQAYTLVATRTGCPRPPRETRNLRLGVRAPDPVRHFRGVIARNTGVLQITEGIPFALEWDVASATSVRLSGDGLASPRTVNQGSGSTLVTPTRLETSELPSQRRTYTLEATLANNVCRATWTDRTSITVHPANVRTFSFFESCGNTQGSGCCLINARSQSEAESVINQSCNRVANGCQWRAGRCRR